MTEPDPNIIPESSAEEEDDVSVIDDDARPSSRGSQAGSVGGRSVRSTKSVTDSILEAVLENGRRYSAYADYYLPNDAAEQTRLNVVHQIYLHLLGSHLTRAPLPRRPTAILDVGSGPGEWAIAMGEKYPTAEIIATDISIFDLDDTLIPANVSFQIDDAENLEWTFSSPFDLIHIRGLAGGFSNWDNVLAECFHHLKPGGYIEISDYDHARTTDPNPPSSYWSIFTAALESSADRSGYPLSMTHMSRETLARAGFIGIVNTTEHIPVGVWDGLRDDYIYTPQSTSSRTALPPKRPRRINKMRTIGKMWLIGLLEGLEAAGLRLLTRYAGWEVEEVRDLCAKVREEFLQATKEGREIWTPVRWAVARKPIFDVSELRSELESIRAGSGGEGGSLTGSIRTHTTKRESGIGEGTEATDMLEADDS